MELPKVLIMDETQYVAEAKLIHLHNGMFE